VKVITFTLYIGEIFTFSRIFENFVAFSPVKSINTIFFSPPNTEVMFRYFSTRHIKHFYHLGLVQIRRHLRISKPFCNSANVCRFPNCSSNTQTFAYFRQTDTQQDSILNFTKPTIRLSPVHTPQHKIVPC